MSRCWCCQRIGGAGARPENCLGGTGTDSGQACRSSPPAAASEETQIRLTGTGRRTRCAQIDTRTGPRQAASSRKNSGNEATEVCVCWEKRDEIICLRRLLMKPCLTVSLTPFQHCSSAITVTRSCRAIGTGLPSRKKATSDSQPHSE